MARSGSPRCEGVGRGRWQGIRHQFTPARSDEIIKVTEANRRFIPAFVFYDNACFKNDLNTETGVLIILRPLEPGGFAQFLRYASLHIFRPRLQCEVIELGRELITTGLIGRL
jgi:hypothetical protein